MNSYTSTICMGLKIELKFLKRSCEFQSGVTLIKEENRLTQTMPEEPESHQIKMDDKMSKVILAESVFDESFTVRS